MAAAEEDVHREVDEVAATLRLRATTLTAMRLQVVVAVADVVAVAAGEADVAVVALRSDENGMMILEGLGELWYALLGLEQ